MLRYTLRYMALMPLALAVVHFLGFSYAYIVGPMQATRQPLYFREVTPGPLLPSYLEHVQGLLLRFDAGVLAGSSAQEPVLSAVGRAAVASLGLLVVSLVLSVLVGMGLGLAAVRGRPPRVAPWLTALATAGLAMPTFFVGSLAVTAIIIQLIYGPPRMGPILPLEGFGWDRHLILPTLVLMLRPTAQIAQITAGLLVEEYGRQYVVTARSIGVSEGRIARRHVLRNVVAPVIAAAAGALRLLAGELIIVETLFYWPGLGSLIAQTLLPSLSSIATESPLFLNPPVLAAVLVVFAAIFMLANLAVTLLVQAADPRLRTA